jgi:methylated-DNA-[protein]-cysteine S-methyltransferase
MTVPTDLDRRFREAAVRAGLLDAGYDVVESPIGPLLVAATDRGLLRISFSGSFDPAATLEEIARVAGPRVLRAPRAVDAAHRELDEYFAGRRHAFDLAVDLRGLAPFSVAVLGELAKVPYGHTATYGELAARAGHPKAARAVGMVMNRNPIPIVLPCHRIVGASGSLVGYAGGLERKVALLELEGAML